MTSLNVVDVHKSFGGTRALAGVSFAVSRGEIVAILGPSGCGKSTLLAVIAGLVSPDRGQVYWREESLRDVPPHRRGFGLMFQDFALFPHMDVFGNIAFGLRMAGLTRDQVRERVEEMLDLVGLPGFASRDVNTLSGGEGQRVALARSLAPKPRLLMLDEPLGALDRTLRERLLVELRAILSQMGQTALYVTHDQEEAFAIADRVVLMNAGLAIQVGTPQEIYHRPLTPFVARFLGLTNLLEGEARPETDRWVVETPIGVLPIPSPHTGRATVLLRPDKVNLNNQGALRLRGVVKERSFRGALYRAVIEIRGVELTFDFDPSDPLPGEGNAVDLSFDPSESIQVFP